MNGPIRLAASGLCLGLLLSARGAAAQAPPSTGTDMELDPDQPAAPEKKPEPPPLPPVEAGAWGVGGTEEEGRFAPGAGKKKDAADAGQAKPFEPGPPGLVVIDAVVGFGGLQIVTHPRQTPTEFTIVSLLAGIRYRLGDVWNLGLRFPFSTGSTKGDQANQTDFDQWALGNLAVDVLPTFELARWLRLTGGASFVAPIASGDYLSPPNDRGAIAQATINEVASASRGWHDQALFASKRGGFVPSVAAQVDSGPLHASLGTKLEVMIKTAGEDAQPAVLPNATLHDPTTNWVSKATFSYDFLDGKLSPGLALWLAVATLPLSNGTLDYSGPQAVLEPAIEGKFPLNSKPVDAKDALAIGGRVGFIQPLGGHLGGAHGLRLDASLGF